MVVLGMADLVTGFKSVKFALFSAAWFPRMLQIPLMITRLISFCILSFYFGHKHQTATQTIIVDLKGNAKSQDNVS